jgi:AcrR family transcriptional regulator
MAMTATPPRLTQVERAALSDARMAEAAVALICERGAAATTLKDVGVRAGYSRGLAGNRFGNKSGLWAFLVRTIGEEWRAELELAMDGTEGLDTIHAAVDAHSRFLLESSERIRAFYILWFDSVGPDAELKEVIAGVHARRRADVAAWIQAGIAAGSIAADADVAGVAEQFCAAIIGIVYEWLVSPDDRERVRALHDVLKEQMTHALRAGGSSSSPPLSPKLARSTP